MVKLLARLLPTRRSQALAVLAASASAVIAVMSIAIANAISAPAPAPSGGNTAEQIGFARLDRPAPGFQLPELTGSGSVSLSKLAGKPIVVNFWSTTCEVCKSETPAIVRVARTLGSRVTFVGVDTLDVRQSAVAFVKHYRVPYVTAFDPNETVGGRYGIPGLPATFFLSPSGKAIIGVNLGALTTKSLTSILRTLYPSA